MRWGAKPRNAHERGIVDVRFFSDVIGKIKDATRPLRQALPLARLPGQPPVRDIGSSGASTSAWPSPTPTPINSNTCIAA
jgi:hypothetical protein